MQLNLNLNTFQICPSVGGKRKMSYEMFIRSTPASVAPAGLNFSRPQDVTEPPDCELEDDANETLLGDDDAHYQLPYLMSWHLQLAWILVFTIMLVIATVGNALVAWIVLGACSFAYQTRYFTFYRSA